MLDKKETKLPRNPWRGWKPGAGIKYDPSKPHFNPLHPPEGYPQEELEGEWGETFDDNPTREKTSSN